MLQFLLSLFIFLCGCNHLFYHPDRHSYVRFDKGKAPEDGFLMTADGEKLHYWLFKPEGEPQGTVVQFHGNAQNMSAHFVYVVWLVQHGYQVMTFDYRGYGKSSGRPSQEGLSVDGQTVLNHICSKENKPVFILGQSLGGAVALGSLSQGSQECACALIVDSSFFSYRRIARAKLDSYWLTWPLQYPLSLLVTDFYESSVLKKIYQPILVVHSEKDPVVPVQFGERVYSSTASSDKSMWRLESQGHIEAFLPGSAYRDKLLNYLRSRSHSCQKEI